MPSKNSSGDYDLIREYENKAQGKTTQELDVLLGEFIEKATKQTKGGFYEVG